MNIYKTLKELNLPEGEYVVVGGAMAAHNIRDAHDLDILVTPNLYQSLLSKGFIQCTCDQCMRTSRLMLKKGDVDILPNLMFGNYVGDTKKLIKTADHINGFSFIKLREFMKFKKEFRRQKDFDDVGLMKKYLQTKHK